MTISALLSVKTKNEKHEKERDLNSLSTVTAIQKGYEKAVKD